MSDDVVGKITTVPDTDPPPAAAPTTPTGDSGSEPQTSGDVRLLDRTISLRGLLVVGTFAGIAYFLEHIKRQLVDAAVDLAADELGLSR